MFLKSQARLEDREVVKKVSFKGEQIWVVTKDPFSCRPMGCPSCCYISFLFLDPMENVTLSFSIFSGPRLDFFRAFITLVQ